MKGVVFTDQARADVPRLYIPTGMSRGDTYCLFPSDTGA
jgi:hypothetical protein